MEQNESKWNEISEMKRNGAKGTKGNVIPELTDHLAVFFYWPLPLAMTVDGISIIEMSKNLLIWR